MIRIKQESIRTADFESEMRKLIEGIKGLKLQDEQKVLWLLNKFDKKLVTFEEQRIETPEFMRVERR